MKEVMCGLIVLLCAACVNMHAVDARLMRQPDVSATHITFVYAGDIWTVPRSGGIAQQLSSPGGEESFPRFSPDGKTIAFSGNYDGNTDVYTIPVGGGAVKRITFHPQPDRLTDWYPDGKRLLFASRRQSGRSRFSRLFSISSSGGPASALPVPYGEFAAFTADQSRLAYTTISREFRTWKRYRGGGTSDIWLYDFKKKHASLLVEHEAVDGIPMWHGSILYFLSDRGPSQRQNIWKLDPATSRVSQVTHFNDFDVTFPAKGPQDIVFTAGGKLYLLGLKDEKTVSVQVEINSDFRTLRPHQADVQRYITGATLSPGAERIVFSARGELFDLPAEHGFKKNLTNSSGSNEIYPGWSADGKKLAFWSDRSGEYELYIKDMNSRKSARKITGLGPGFRYFPHWSPDGRMIAFADNQNRIMLLNVAEKKVIQAAELDSLTHPGLERFSLDWSADSCWFAYSRTVDNFQSAVFVYNVKQNKSIRLTSAFYSDYAPVFDPGGQYLYFFSNRSLSPRYSSVDSTWTYPDSTVIMAVPLRKETASPLAERNDEVTAKEKKNGKNAEAGSDKSMRVAIDLKNFESRAVVLQPAAGRYTDLRAAPGQVIYRRYVSAGNGRPGSQLISYDLKKRKEMTILAKAGPCVFSASRKKVLVAVRGSYFLVDLKPNQKLSKKIDVSRMYMTVNPQQEWLQLFTDTWRRYRDFFYDPNLHGVDWDQLRQRYGDLLKQAVTRWDVNYLIGSLIAEINSSHTYVGGGDLERPVYKRTGLLGIDWEAHKGAYRVRHIVQGAPWDSEVRSPLNQPGVDISEGDYILAVNGIPINSDREPYAAFAGLADTTVQLTVNSVPDFAGARQVLVKTLASEMRLRNLEWINANRIWTDTFSRGKVGYIYMPNTGTHGQTELIRQYYGQLDREAFIIDERFNSGGQLADRFIELLSRKPAHLIARRYGRPWTSFPKASSGPKVMLINGWSVSGGDAFPYVFKMRKIGTIVGTRTAGGLIGPATGHRLMDGGYITVPGGRIYDNSGRWFPEGRGVEPHIRVTDDQDQLIHGVDPQLKAGIIEALRLLKENPVKKADPPDFENRTAAETAQK